MIKRRKLHPWRTALALWIAPWLRREIEDLRELARWNAIKYEVTRDT